MSRDTHSKWKIEIMAEADTKEAAMAMFETQLIALRDSAYVEQFYSGVNFQDERDGYRRSVTRPQPLPLFLDEIEKLRSLIAETPNAP